MNPRFICCLLVICLASQMSILAAEVDPWVTAGGDRRAKDELTAILDEAVASAKITGASVLVMSRGHPVYARGFGWADQRHSRPFTADEPLRLASITKQVAGTLVAVLASEGLLHFDDPVSQYIPAFNRLQLPDGTSVRSPTIAECLSNTGGFLAGGVRTEPDDSPVFTGNLEQAAEVIAARGMVGRPGTEWNYGFRGFAVASRCVEVAAGKSYEEVLASQLLRPLGMKHTTLHPTADILAQMPVEPSARKFYEQFRGGFINMGDSLISTADDMARFYALHTNHGRVGGKELVTTENWNALFQRRPASQRNYGLGFRSYGVGAAGQPTRLGGWGSTGVVGWCYPHHDLIVLILTQSRSPRLRPVVALAMGWIEAAFLPYEERTRIADPIYTSAVLESIDSDADGRLTRSELEAISESRFDRLDRNDDGAISIDELTPAL
jgi:CubicO group peptidase (beta-lactamase class C family)